MKPLLVLCLGNEVVSDDALGFVVAERLTGVDLPPEVEVTAVALAGFGLLELLQQRRAVLIVDAIVTGKEPPGHIHFFRAGTMTPTQHLVGSHQINLPHALQLGQMLGLDMPERIDVLAVEAADVQTLAEQLTPPVEHAVPKVVQKVIDWIEQTSQEGWHAGTRTAADTVA